MTKRCTICGNSFEARRKDAKYCSNSCKTKASKNRKKRRNIKGSTISTPIVKNDVLAINKSILQEKQRVESEIKRLTTKFEKLQETYIWNHTEKQKLITMYEEFEGGVKTLKSRISILQKAKIVDESAINNLKIKLKEYNENIDILDSKIEDIHQLPNKISKIIEDYTNLIGLYIKRLESLDKLIFARKSQPQKEDLKPKKITGNELLEMEFDTFILPNKLGQFLGNLDRSMLAISLTGDSGAGKTHFSFLLAQTFLNGGFIVEYFSLELGISLFTKQLVQKYGCNGIKMTDTGTLSDVKESAKTSDVVIVDSFGKLGAKASDFDRLRQEHPNTIFICIFQKTSAGTMRGGASIMFDSSMNIDIVLRENERIAVMEKSRYGTTGWEYSITENQIIKSN